MTTTFDSPRLQNNNVNLCKYKCNTNCNTQVNMVSVNYCYINTQAKVTRTTQRRNE